MGLIGFEEKCAQLGLPHTLTRADIHWIMIRDDEIAVWQKEQAGKK